MQHSERSPARRAVEQPRPLGRPLFGVALCLAIPFFGCAILEALGLENQSWPHENLHSVVEALGGGIALVLARLMLLEMKHNPRARHLMVVATALVMMGVLDIVHALSPVGNAFHWTRALSTLLGGVLFGTVWLAPEWSHARWLHLPLSAGVVAALVGLLMLLHAHRLPSIFEVDGGYTAAARIMNVGGGAGFIVSALWFVRRFFNERGVEDLAFANQCALFGVAGLLFALGHMWHPIWWSFHLLRLLAYLAVLRYTFNLFGASQQTLATANEILEQRVRARTAELQDEKAAREQFVLMLTHDLRNPLAAALLSAKLLVRGSDDAREVAARATRITGSLERAAAMITDLLDANRIQAGQPIPLEAARCDLGEICSEVAADFGAVHGASRFVVEGAASATGWWSCDGLRRVVENLVGNAVKYGASDQPITIRVEADPHTTRLSVHNHGTPLAPREQSRIFTAFVRGEAARSSGQRGWGIGLTLVHGLVGAHGGSVSIDSGPERGTTFTVELPTDARSALGARARVCSRDQVTL